ncbi:receptor-like protein eix2 [Quercus suber]|uniref:Receptor-like protein eix2 n=1 Tax=Quercus suber TaxID=58331 RepID=A0AAW0LG97_QUESU
MHLILQETQHFAGDETPNQSELTDNEEDGDELVKWFYVGIGCGFAIGFWGVCCSLVFKRSWRHAYFLLFDKMKDWLYVTLKVNMTRLWRKFQRQG